MSVDHSQGPSLLLLLREALVPLLLPSVQV
jgi:hypothetical protein